MDPSFLFDEGEYVRCGAIFWPDRGRMGLSRHIYGNKETFHLAWRKLGAEYAMPSRGLVELPCGVMCQHDFAGRRIFQHRSRAKWTVSRANQRVPGFVGEDLALSFLDRLRERWSG